MDTRYRETSGGSGTDDEKSGDSCSDSDEPYALWKKKRPKVQSLPVHRQEADTLPMKTARNRGSKNSNIWKSVLTEQSSNDISSSFGAVGMKYYMSRGPESFDLTLAYKEKEESSSSDELEEEENPISRDESIEIKSTVTQMQIKPEVRLGKRKITRKRSNNVPIYKPGQRVTLNKRCDMSDTDTVDTISEEISFRLWERKKDLIRGLVEVLGVPSSIKFYNKTEEIEGEGGLLILKGSRRRTPGGTFIHLIRNDPDVDQDPINKVFELEAEREQLIRGQRKKEQRKKKLAERKYSNVDQPSVNDDVNSTHFMDIKDVYLKKQAPIAAVKASGVESTTHDGAKVAGFHTNFCATTSFSKDNTELSDGEIIDSDDEAGDISMQS